MSERESVSRSWSERSALTISYRRLDELKPHRRNPRRHDRRQLRQIEQSIRAFGFVVPVLIDGKDEIVAGHGRCVAAQALGMTEVPTVRLEHLSEAQVTALRIADNRLTEIAVWDDRLLAEQLKELSELELAFNIEATGFAMGEIDLRIEGLSASEELDDPADTLPSPGPVVSRPGDLWLLGRHRVLCGSAIDDGAFTTLMEGEQAALIFTDPPYNVPIDGHASGLGAIHHRDFVMASGEMSAAEFVDFLNHVLTLLARHSKDGSIHFVCMDWRHVEELLAAGRAVYAELKNLCVWVKSNAGMGSLYRSQHELIAVFKKGRAPHRNNVRLGEYGRHRTNVWEYPCINSFGRSGEEGNLLALHPTVKPVAMVWDALLDCSARGEVVLDGFLGSGTTLIAAERTGRRCFGLELDPGYIDTVIRRWQAYSGESARYAATGASFAEIASERVSL